MKALSIQDNTRPREANVKTKNTMIRHGLFRLPSLSPHPPVSLRLYVLHHYGIVLEEGCGRLTSLVSLLVFHIRACLRYVCLGRYYVWFFLGLRQQGPVLQQVALSSSRQSKSRTRHNT